MQGFSGGALVARRLVGVERIEPGAVRLEAVRHVIIEVCSRLALEWRALPNLEMEALETRALGVALGGPVPIEVRRHMPALQAEGSTRSEEPDPDRRLDRVERRRP